MVKAKKKTSVKKPNPQRIIRRAAIPNAQRAVAPISDFLQTTSSKLLARPEGVEVDFKRDADAVKQDDLVAFANGVGGVILVGVDETKGRSGAQKGVIVGCDVSDRERNKIVSRASQCRPAIAVRITIQTFGKLSVFRVDIPKGGLHCTTNGAYKIRRDGQIDIIDPSLMAQIIVALERNRILYYLRSAIRPELESAQEDIEALHDEFNGNIEDLRSELSDHGDGEEFEDGGGYYSRDHDER